MRTWVERTVVLRRTERYEESSIEAEPGNAVTYALCGLRRGDPNGFSKFLKRCSLISTDRRKILVDCFHRWNSLMTLLHPIRLTRIRWQLAIYFWAR